MTIGVLRLELFIPDSNSLKAKRMVLHSIKARLRNSFNLAVTQIDVEDKWQKATLAVVGVERERSCMNSTLSEAVNFIERIGTVSLIDYEMEML
jgi:uncharacterized protein YlxP (DUF503 family)